MWNLIGQSRITSLLRRSLEAGNLAHAYLLTGPPHVGKMTLALEMAQAVNCGAEERPCGECDSCRKIAASGHADVQIIGLAPQENGAADRVRTEISIDQVRQVQHSASLPPFEGNYKVFIIESAEFLSNEAANSLLKTLEEPVDNVIFILLTVSEGLLPVTVVSRCQRLELKPVAAAEIASALSTGRGVEPQRAELLARLCHGCPSWAIAAADDDSLLRQHEDEVERLQGIIAAGYGGRFAEAAATASRFSQSRSAVYELLDLWLDYWRDLLLVKLGCDDMVTNLDRAEVLADTAGGFRLGQIRNFMDSLRRAREQLGQNVNPRLALEVLMLDMPEKEKNVTKQTVVNYG